MNKVPILPFERLSPEILKNPRRTQKAAKEDKQEPKTPMKTAKKAKPLDFQYTNTDNPEDKPEILRDIWKILQKMDPENKIMASDEAIIALQGDLPKERFPSSLGLDENDLDLLLPFAVPDGPVDEDGSIIPESVTGVLVSLYQIVELAYYAGVHDAQDAIDDHDSDEEDEGEDENADVDVMDEENFDDDEDDDEYDDDDEQESD